MQICNPVLRALGWDVDDPFKVMPEYKVGNLRVDIALNTSHKREPVIFIEVKAVGKCSASGEEQLFHYAANQGGVPLIIFTDGNEWHFYNTHGSGSYESRKVVRFRLENANDCAKHFTRYLGYDRVKNEQAFEDLRNDYKRIKKQRESKRAIPGAWKELVNSRDDLLVGIIVEQVKTSSHGELVPEEGDVIQFLEALEASKPSNNRPQKPDGGQENGTEPEDSPPSPRMVHRYKIGGEVKSRKKAIQVYCAVLDHVIAKYGWSEELKRQQWIRLKSRGGLGHGYHISNNEDDIPKGPEHKRELNQSGIWVNTNLSAKDMSKLLVAVGEFYSRVKNREILGNWGSGAEVEFDLRPGGKKGNSE